MHNNFLLKIYIKEGSVWLQHHSICNWLTYTIDLFRVMAEADSTSIDMSFPESIPEIEWDARRYCYSNGVDVTDGTADITKICHSPTKFEFNIHAREVSPHTSSRPLPQLIGEFIDSVLITRIGIRAKVLYKCKPVVRIRVNIRKGDIASCSDLQKGYENISYPTTNVKSTYAIQHVDHGKYCHIRAHRDYCLELDTNITGDALITDIEIFIRVQAPERVGGIFDHHSWDPDSVARDNPIKSVKKYNEYKFQDDGEDIATRRLFWGKI